MGNLKIGHTKKTTANITLQKPIKKTDTVPKTV